MPKLHIVQMDMEDIMVQMEQIGLQIVMETYMVQTELIVIKTLTGL